MRAKVAKDPMAQLRLGRLALCAQFEPLRHPEFDQYYGKPLGRAVETTKGWKREFEGCTVTVTANLVNSAQQVCDVTPPRRASQPFLKEHHS